MDQSDWELSGANLERTECPSKERLTEMADVHLALSANFPPNTRFGGPKPRTGARKLELTESRPRAAPARDQALLGQKDELIRQLSALWETSANRLAGLTRRQRQIMELVLTGRRNKNIAADLGISQRTVENHRAIVMKKTGSKSLLELVRFALAATWNDAPEPRQGHETSPTAADGSPPSKPSAQNTGEPSHER